MKLILWAFVATVFLVVVRPVRAGSQEVLDLAEEEDGPSLDCIVCDTCSDFATDNAEETKVKAPESDDPVVDSQMAGQGMADSNETTANRNMTFAEKIKSFIGLGNKKNESHPNQETEQGGQESNPKDKPSNASVQMPANETKSHGLPVNQTTNETHATPILTVKPESRKEPKSNNESQRTDVLHGKHKASKSSETHGNHNTSGQSSQHGKSKTDENSGNAVNATEGHDMSMNQTVSKTHQPPKHGDHKEPKNANTSQGSNTPHGKHKKTKDLETSSNQKNTSEKSSSPGDSQKFKTSKKHHERSESKTSGKGNETEEPFVLGNNKSYDHNIHGSTNKAEQKGKREKNKSTVKPHPLPAKPDNSDTKKGHHQSDTPKKSDKRQPSSHEIHEQQTQPDDMPEEEMFPQGFKLKVPKHGGFLRGRKSIITNTSSQDFNDGDQEEQRPNENVSDLICINRTEYENSSIDKGSKHLRVYLKPESDDDSSNTEGPIPPSSAMPNLTSAFSGWSELIYPSINDSKLENNIFLNLNTTQ